MIKKLTSRFKTKTPSEFVIFGATGDLALKKIFPSLDTLFQKGEIKKVIAVSRRKWSRQEFVDFLLQNNSFSADFLEIIDYVEIDIEKEENYEVLKSKCSENVSVYLSLAPKHHKNTVSCLFKYKIINKGRGKLLIEKPFGTSEKIARDLDMFLLKNLKQNQIFRIDHYLGKETILAIMNLHEMDSDFNNLISGKHISSIRIRLFEEGGINDRGAFYDEVGAFRDVGQNHVLEMLAVICADYKKNILSKSYWQNIRSEVIKSLVPPSKTCELSTRGQYTGFLLEKGISTNSQTETSFSVITSIKNKKMSNVAIILEAGKKMPKNEVSIEIKFKENLPDYLPLKMIFDIQPEQKVSFEYKDGKKEIFIIEKKNDAYVNIIKASIDGSNREFVGSEEIIALWNYSDRVVDCWKKVPLDIY